MVGIIVVIALLLPGVLSFEEQPVIESVKKIETVTATTTTGLNKAVEKPTVSVKPATTTPKSPVVVKSRSEVRDEVVKEFGAGHIMVAVASCESRFMQFNKDGTVRRGIQNPKDVGVFQVNEHYHLATSKKLGMNIHTLAGNIAYSRYLYDREGTTPWNWSKFMWEKGECEI